MDESHACTGRRSLERQACRNSISLKLIQTPSGWHGRSLSTKERTATGALLSTSGETSGFGMLTVAISRLMNAQ